LWQAPLVVFLVARGGLGGRGSLLLLLLLLKRIVFHHVAYLS